MFLSDLQPARGARCLITGCALFNPASGAVTWGDLHALGDTYIFNGVPELSSTFVIDHNHKMISVYGEFFERRNVWVFPKTAGILNHLAETYINDNRY